MTTPTKVGSATTLNTSGGYVASQTTSIAVGAGANRCLVVGVQTNNSDVGATTISMTWNGNALLEVGGGGESGRSEQIHLFYLPESLLSTATANLVITCNGLNQSIGGFAQVWQDANQVLPWNEPRYNSTLSGATLTLGTVPSASGDATISLVTLYAAAGGYTFAVTAPATQLGQINGGSGLSVGMSDDTPSGTTISMGWTASTSAIEQWLLCATLRGAPTSAQTARPASDSSTGSWAATGAASLFGTMNEATQSDAEFATDGGATTMEVALGTLTDPVSSVGHGFGFRFKGSNTLTAELRQGASTSIATFTPTRLDNPPVYASNPGQGSAVTWQESFRLLTGGEADAITDYTALRLRFTSAALAQMMPIFLAKGTFQSGTGALTVPPPAAGTYGVGDLLLLFIESANQTIATPTGWSPLTNSPQSTGSAGLAGGVRLAVFSKVATSTAEASVSVADSGDHTTSIMCAYGGCDASSIHITAGSVDAAGTTSMSWPSVTTTAANCLIVLAVAMDTDAASTATVASETNAALSNLTERHDQTVIAGAGGGLVICDGGKATAGATGATTATGSTSVTHAYLTIALKPAAATPIAISYAAMQVPVASGSTFSASATDAVTAADSGTGLAVKPAAASDAATAADSAVQQYAATGNASDAVAAADSATSLGTFGHVASDAATLGDSGTGLNTIATAATDAATAADSGTAAAVFPGAASDAVSVADSGTGALAIPAAASDAASPGDSATQLAVLPAVASDAATLGSTGAALAVLPAAATDAVSAGDSGAQGAVLPAAATDAVSAADSAAQRAVLPASATDAASAADSGTGLLAIPAAATDAASAGDSATQLAVLPAVATDAASAADSGTGLLAIPAAATDAATPADSGTSAVAVSSVATDAAAPADSGVATLTLPAVATDAASPGDSAATLAILPAAASDAAAAGDSAAQAAVLPAVATDAATLGSTGTAALVQGAAASDAATPGDSGVSLLAFAAAGTDAVAPGDSAATLLVATAAAQDAATAGDQASAQATLAASASDAATASDSAQAISGGAAVATDAVAPADSAIAALATFAQGTDAILVGDLAEALGVLAADAADPLALADAGAAFLAVVFATMDGVILGDSAAVDGGHTLGAPSIEADLIALLRAHL